MIVLWLKSKVLANRQNTPQMDGKYYNDSTWLIFKKSVFNTVVPALGIFITLQENIVLEKVLDISNIRKNWLDLQNIKWYFKPIYGTSNLSTVVILTVGSYQGMKETGAFWKLSNNNYYDNYNSRVFFYNF